MPTATKGDISHRISEYMDEIGFSNKRIQERIHYSNKCSRAKDISTKNILKNDQIEKVFVGSIREGIGVDYCNDIDILQINHAVLCCNDGTTYDTDKLLFKMEQKQAPAGYTLLKMISTRTNTEAFEDLKYAMVDMKEGKYLSSKLFMTKHDDVFQLGDGFISKNTYYKSPKGPSIPKFVKRHWIENYGLSLFNLTDQNMDFVRAFPCHEDNILKAWKNRERNCDWPTQQIIMNVISMPMYVVPVGKKDSKNEDLQWRLSFTMAEIHLVQTFNNTQTKVFVLLKLIAKHILKPVCSSITSYIMKTVMLWQAENISQGKFCEKHLLSRLMDALEFLKNAVKERILRNYMIPQKNMLSNKMTREQQESVITKLEFLLLHGQRYIFDFFYGCLKLEDHILDIGDTIYVANDMDKMQTVVLNTFTVVELADFFTRMFKCKSIWVMMCYTAIFIQGPFFIRYATQGFEPYSDVLLDCLAENDMKAQNAIEQRSMTTMKEPKTSQSKEQSNIHQNCEEAGKLEHNNLIPLVKISVTFHVILLFLVIYILTNLLFNILTTWAMQNNHGLRKH